MKIVHGRIAGTTLDAFVDQVLQVGNLRLPLLVAANELAHLVAGVPESPAFALAFDPSLHLFGKRDVHSSHVDHLDSVDVTIECQGWQRLLIYQE